MRFGRHISPGFRAAMALCILGLGSCRSDTGSRSGERSPSGGAPATAKPPAPAQAPAPAPPPGAPTLGELGEASYSGLEQIAGPVTLKGGRWEGEPAVAGGASRPTVTLAPGFRVTGDLDGDGVDEAVVLLAQSSGGSGTFDYLAVAKRTAQGVASVATAPLGDRVQVRSARIANGKVSFAVLRPGPEDARCCPGELADLDWTLGGGTLRPDAARVTGRLTLDALAGTEWVLRAWSIGEPAPSDPEITLTYQSGRLAGTSGCNRYTTAVKARQQPGDFSIGPVAGTRMACPEPRSTVEARFLAQLGSANKFGFWLGRLALSYPKEGQLTGTMLFEARTPATGPGH